MRHGAPEEEVEGGDGEAVFLVQLAGKLQAEAGLLGCTLHAHLGSRAGPHVRHIEHIPQQTSLCMLPATQCMQSLQSMVCDD